MLLLWREGTLYEGFQDQEENRNDQGIQRPEAKEFGFLRLMRSTDLRMMEASRRWDFNQKRVLIYKRLDETSTTCVSRVRSTASLKFMWFVERLQGTVQYKIGRVSNWMNHLEVLCTWTAIFIYDCWYGAFRHM